MEKESKRNVNLGIFIIVSIVLIVVALYYVGDKQNLFGKNFKISANFKNVNGLQVGNNVRFGGMNIGTVKQIEITSDSTILVEMILEDQSQHYIKKNSLVSIGTDGLMGNKIVNINNVINPSAMVENGDFLQTLIPIETDEMLRTLNRTNEDISVIAKNLRVIMEKVNSPNSLWSILMDTIVADNLKRAIVNIKITSWHTAMVSGDLSNISKQILQGKGSLGALLTDSTLGQKVKQSIVNIQILSDTLAMITGDMKSVAANVKNGKGAIGTLLMDTNFVHNLNKGMESFVEGTEGFNQNMEALKHSIFLRGYFRRQAKAENKN